MKYLTALVPLLLLFLIDLLFIASIIGLFIFWDNGGPYSYQFARRIWT